MPADWHVAAVPSFPCQMIPLASEQNDRVPVAPTLSGTATELYVARGVLLQLESEKKYPRFVPEANTVSRMPPAVVLTGWPGAGGPSSLKVQVYPTSGNVVAYVVSAVVIVRIEATADASLAASFDRIRLGMAMAAMIRMIAITISNSISENPFAFLIAALFPARGGNACKSHHRPDLAEASGRVLRK